MKVISESLELKILNNIIASRRAIFPDQYTGGTVKDDQIKIILNNAKWAPTHRRTEPWLFHVFSAEAKKRLSSYLGAWYKRHTPEESFSELKYRKTIEKPLLSSHVLAICMRRDPEKRVPEWEEIAAVACAVQNMWLTCAAMELGCYWSTPGSALSANDFLGLSKGERCLGWFYIGVPKAGVILKSQRTDIASKTIWHQ